MSDSYIGEIRLFGGEFAPENWAFCDGRTLPILGNETLFSVIGATYGGDGQTTFNLPDLRGRFPINQGQLRGGANYLMGQAGGSETVTLTEDQLPRHNHAVTAVTAKGDQPEPTKLYWATSPLNNFALTKPEMPMANCVEESGGGQPHENMIPFQVINFIISLTGIVPSTT